jgi:phage baseplate assembly protein W
MSHHTISDHLMSSAYGGALRKLGRWDVGVAVKNTASMSLREAVENILDTPKGGGSLQKIFAANGVRYLDASSATAGRQGARDAS